ncbi:ParA family protein [Alloscardovia criceti]|uniref:ParA family protein n=1 Tax=Alloscardovia criceti TaxID=356828 RepID=UPI0003639B26|nr:AAA family ATPase [Alloscardovia criceti]
MSNVSRETLPDDNPQFEPASEVIDRIFHEASDSTVGFEVADEKKRYESIASLKFEKPKSTRYIAVANQKGGVGKTTSSVNLAAAFAEAGMNVLLLDMDPQGNASTALGAQHESGTASLYDVIEGRSQISDVIQVCPDFDNLDVVPSTIDLSGAELEIAALDNRVYLLRDQLRAFMKASKKKYDYVIIDCPPSLGLLVLNSLCAVHEVIIPIQAEYYALEGLGQLLRTIQLVQKSMNKQLVISAILITMYDKRTLLSQEVYQEVEEHYANLLLKTTIPRAVRISEAPSFAQSVIAYDPRGAGAIAYREAAYEINQKSAQILKRLDRSKKEQ